MSYQKICGYICEHPNPKRYPSRVMKTQRAAFAYADQFVKGVVTVTPLIKAPDAIAKAEGRPS